VTALRYRSRRDFIAIQTDPEFHAILPYRLAAREENIRLRLPATLIPPPLLALLLLLLLPLKFLTLVSGKSTAQGRNVPLIG